MKKIVRILRPLFFVLFFVLVSQQALIVWLVLYALSLVFPALFGKRLYCTAVCPMNTLMLGVVWLKGKLGRLDKPTPKWLKSGWLAYVSLGLTVALFIISRRLLGGICQSCCSGLLLPVASHSSITLTSSMI